MEETEKDSYGHPRIPLRGHYDINSCDERRHWAEKFTSCSLEVTGEWWKNQGKDDSMSCKKLMGNIENPFGLAKIPVGLAGPLLMKGDHVSGYVICPFATTEGALVASATRGAALLTRAGGVRCKVIEQVMIRSPIFVMSSLDDAEMLYSWVIINKRKLQEQVKMYSQFSLLFGLEVQRFGKNIVIIMKFTTNDAAGQNMVTTVTWHTCKWTIKEFEKENPSIKINKFYVESILSGDKRATSGYFTSCRGTHVIAEAWIPKSVVENTFKTTVEDMLCFYGIIQSTCRRIGTIGCNLNVANTLGAIYTATGQDIAGLIETYADLIIEPASYSHNSFTNDDNDNLRNGIYACLVIPSLVIGTVGGGTGLATQMECLKMMNCYGTGKVSRLAEIIAGFALSLDLSTLASISNGTFALTHERLGKNRPDSGLKETHFNDQLFSNILKNFFKEERRGEEGILVSWTPLKINTGDSILSELAKSERLKKKIGHFGFKIKYKIKGLNKEGREEKELSVVLKSKTIDSETCNVINKMAQNCGFSLAMTHEKYKTETGFKDCHIREINLAKLDDAILREFTPKVYQTIISEKDDIFAFVMEYLRDDFISHFDTVNNISVWTIPDVKVILRDLAKLHSHFMINCQELLFKSSWLHLTGLNEMKKLQPLWIDLLKHAELEFPNFWTKDKVQFLNEILQDLPQFWSGYETAPKTLSHNDCNPRNICIKIPPPTSSRSSPSLSGGTVPYSDPRKMCLYDWELARIDLPQHDLVEFLAFCLPVQTDLTTRLQLIDFYRQHFIYYSGMDYPNERFMSHYHIACLDFAINRLPYYTMVHTYKDYKFLPRVIESHFAYIFQNLEKFKVVKKSRL